MDSDRLSPAVIKPQPATSTTLNGHWLWIGRFCWLVVTVLVLLILSQIWPENGRITYSEWFVSRTRPAISTFMAYADFVSFVTILESLSTLTALLMGFVIFWYKSNDKMGLFVSAFLILIAPWILSGNMETWRLPIWIPFGSSLIPIVQAATLGSMVLFFYLFPDGRFVPQWTRWPAVLMLLALGAFVLGNFFIIPTPIEYIWLIYAIAFFSSLLVAGAAQLYRYRTHSDPVQRQQMKWVIFGIGLYIVTRVPGSLGLLGGSSIWGPVIELLFLLLTQWFISLAIGFSILRYRLWDIDLIINRTVVYGGLTAVILTFYILTVGLMSTILQTGSNVALSVLATGLIAILFNPLRQYLQTAVNRLMYGERDDPITVLTALGRRLEETAVPTETLPALVETIAQTLKLPYVAIVAAEEQGGEGAEEQGSGGAGEIISAYPSPLASPLSPLAFPLIYQSATIGQLLVSPRAPGETFNPAEIRLLKNVARQAGTAVYAAQLTRDLQRSRERLVTAREEERRRIHRDLHDGLGPQLATLSLKVDTARNHLAQDINTADQLLVDLKSDIQNAISDIRRLVHDLRPPALDQLGLVSALQEYLVRQNGNEKLHISLTAPDNLPLLPAAVEVAAYRIALEALTNTLRHAQARTCQLHLKINNGLHLQIRDDGIGLPIGYHAGIGLSSMRERTTELGGTFQIESKPGSGTVISVQLPL